jgi:transcriptional regulator with XRE-family HTH domain
MDAVNDNIQIECGRRAIDIFVGGRLQARRVELGLEQSDLADDIGTTPEQIGAYEHGIERITPAHLIELRKLLRVKLTFFFTRPSRTWG